jgi:AAA15 family ATPase/GTPase
MSSCVPKYKGLTVEGLFGNVTHRIELNQKSPVTILAGPNGSGKTHVLKLYRALLGLDLRVLMFSPYSSISLTFIDGRKLIARRTEDGDMSSIDLLGVSNDGTDHLAQFSSGDSIAEGTEEDLPSSIHQTQDGRWFDARQNKYLTPNYIRNRYKVEVGGETSRAKVIFEHPWLADFLPYETPILIDTKRLDTSYYQPPVRVVEESLGGSTRTIVSRGGTAGRIGEYIEQVRQQITEARRESLQRSQEADEKFVATLLKRSRSTVKEEKLKARYERLAAIHAELNESGLTGQAAAVQFPAATNPTERRILNVFIEDWEKKLAPLIPVNDKLKVLRRIVNEKFMRKTLALDSRGYMKFSSSDGADVSVDQLSSGEQHLLALFTMLLFAAHPGSVVLIDEPEISLHAAWKHAFVGDLEQVAELSDLSVVMATHSSAIINGRWELVRELELPE